MLIDARCYVSLNVNEFAITIMLQTIGFIIKQKKNYTECDSSTTLRCCLHDNENM